MAPRKKTGRGKTLNAKDALAEADAARADKTANTTLLMPPAATVISLASEKRKTKKRVGEINGEHGKSVQAAVEKKHLDKTAFAMAARLDAMSDEKLSTVFPHLMKYLDDLDVPKRAAAQQQMFGKVEGEPEGSFRNKLRVVQGENYGKPVPVDGRKTDETAGAAATG